MTRFPCAGLILLLLASVAHTQPHFPGNSEPWPKAEPEALGYSSEQLAAARANMTTDDGAPFEYVHAIVIKDGHDIFHYGDPYVMPKGMRAQKDWASCGRSFMTTLYGMAMKEEGHGVEFLEQPVRTSYNSTVAWEMDERILNKHLLSYTACSDPPGAEWTYACKYFDMYRILRDVDGRNPSHRLMRLASMIGARWEPSEYWGHGHEVPFLSIRASAAEAARWGYLWLHRGRWNGHQILDEAFVDMALQPVLGPDGTAAHHSEGYQIHLNTGGMWGEIIPRDAYAAFGAGGKIIFVAPSLDLVIALDTGPPPYARRDIDGYIVRDIRNLIEPILAARLTE